MNSSKLCMRLCGALPSELWWAMGKEASAIITVWAMRPTVEDRERVRLLEAALEAILEISIWEEDAILVAQDIAEKVLGKRGQAR